jgi:hypothetical protein
VFAAVVGLGAFLLFEVQLLLGKQLLPWFGGTSAVWTTCLLFFQAALLAGYGWAHFLAARLSPRRQRFAHLLLLAVALASLAGRALAWPSPITPGAAVGRAAVDAPIRSILVLLTSTIGLPFVALAATSPLLQAWLAQRRPGSSPFRLFALSNAGSLLGLVGYPLLVEPTIPVRTQGWLWSAAFAVYSAGVAWCAVTAARSEPLLENPPRLRTGRVVPDRARADPLPGARAGPLAAMRPTSPWPALAGGDRPAAGSRLVTALLWLALAFFPSVMLAAVTSHLTQEVAAVPFLWMLPLALYLLTFIITFAWPDAGRAAWRVALAAAAGLALVGLYGALVLGVTLRLALWSAVLFAYGMAGHGELARRRPEPAGLTGYYLAIAAGGALGGLLNAVVAPLVFSGYWELHLGILAGPAVVLAAAWAASTVAARQRRVAAALAVVVLAVTLAADVRAQGRGVERTSRGFYGVLRVVRAEPGGPDENVRLLHGRIAHGTQLAASGRRRELTAYYGPSSGVGLAIRRHPKRLGGRPLRVGVVGLGVGTLAAWSGAGDVVRFYELDPEVARLSGGERPPFTYLRDARGEVSVALGDGRVALEREAPQGYDVLAVDAFSSDAIPTHLLTVEAFAVYQRHLAAEGVLAVHVTNRYLDLKAVVRGAAGALSLQAEHVPSVEKGILWSSDWMLVARDRTVLDDEVVSAATLPRLPHADEVAWTDGWSNLLRVVKR